MPYNSGARKAMSAMKKRYGSRWKRVYFGKAMKTAKRKGVKGKPHTKANATYKRKRRRRR